MNDADKKLLYVCLAVVALALALLFLAGNVFTPFLIAFALAYLVDPLVDKMERWKLSRTTSVVILLVVFFLTAFLGLVILVPVFRIQVEHLAASLPNYIEVLEEWIHPYLEQLALVDPEKMKRSLIEALKKAGTLPVQILGSATSLVWKSISSLVTVALVLVNLAIIPVAMFYLLRDYDGIIEKSRALVPPRFKKTAFSFMKDIDEVLSGFVRGQLMVATLMASLYTVGLFICGTPMSLFLGILAGYANLVPYLGLVLGFVPAAILTFLQFQSLAPVLGVIVVFGVVQALEGMVITPRVVGDKIGLHPVAIMLAVLLGAELFGFAGVLLAVPVAAVLNVLRRRLMTRYKESKLFD